MAKQIAIEDCLQTAIVKIQHFVEQVTGEAATQAEIADALQKYFVLNEIKDHILMTRQG